VSDTPKQAGYNIECPGVINITCGNGPYGDMYMNYMDLTNDACMNLFTQGQKARMRTLFDQGGPRSSLLVSKGLNPPLISEIELPEEDPKWLHPAIISPTLQLRNLPRSCLRYEVVGEKFKNNKSAGPNHYECDSYNQKPTHRYQSLQPGVYLLAAKKDDGQSMKLKFVKL
jgi:hypothetical protein